METWAKEKLITEIQSLQEKLSFYQAKLRDLVRAYKSLVTEKEALESSIEILKNATINTNAETNNSSEESKNDSNFNSEVTTLMNSLATLSAEKSRMEASFQADKKLLRQEKEKNEVILKDLQEKLKNITYESSKEIEQLKSRLIIEKHEREREQNDNVVMISELQKLLSQEQMEKNSLEKRFTELTSKFQLMINKEEFDRFKESNMTEKFVDLQKKHLEVLEEERKRMLHTEHESKEQIVIHERRVANLELRLTELSLTVANYHKLRQEDQNEITKLKAHIAELDNSTKCTDRIEEQDFDMMKNASETELTVYVKSLMDKMMKYKTILQNAKEFLGKPIEVDNILCDKCNTLEAHFVNLDVHKKLLDKYESLMQQFNESSKTVDEMENLKIKSQVLQNRNKILTDQIDDTVKKYEKDLEVLQMQISSIQVKHSKEIDSLSLLYKSQVIELENQLQKQRDRTLALLDEKEQEVSTLKSSFQIFLPGNKKASEYPQNEKHSMRHSQLTGVLDGSMDIGTSESPHILHYAHELARRDVDITNLRKNCSQLESMLHEAQKVITVNKEKSAEEIASLKKHIERLERCQSREGVNLEYLKNVIANFFISHNTSSRRHMFHAITTILKFTEAEIQEIKVNTSWDLLK